jgi:hypothetical protein
MPKYYYKVDEKICAETYKFHAKKDLFADGYYPLSMTLVVEATNEIESEKIRIAATDIRMWNLDHIED